MNHQLVFVVYKLPELGYAVEGRVVSLMENGKMSLSSAKVYLNTLPDYEIEPTDPIVKLLQLVEECTIRELERKFTPKSRSASQKKDVFENLQTKKIVVNFIETKLSQCLELVSENNFSLYFSTNNRVEVVESNQLFIEKEPLKTLYSFKKEDDSISYQLKVSHLDQTIQLKDKNGEIICNTPGWVKIGNKLYRTTHEVNGLRLMPFFKKDFISVPKQNEIEFFKKIILKAVGSSNVEHEGFNVHVNKTLPCLSLVIDYHVLNQGYGFRAEFVYDKEVFLMNNPQRIKSKLLINNDLVDIFQTERNLVWEKETLDELEKIGLEQQGGAYLLPKFTKNNQFFPSLDVVYNFVLNNKQLFDDLNINVSKKVNFEGKTVAVASPQLIKSFESSNYDWFDACIHVQFNTFSIPFSSFKNHILEQNQFYQLPDETFMMIPKEWFAQYKEAFELGEIVEDKLRLKKVHKELLTFSEVTNDLPSEELKENNVLISTPSYINATLRPYQLEGVNWLIQLHDNKRGGCLADDMGLGKTLQVISLLAYLKETVSPTIHSKPNGTQIQFSLFDVEEVTELNTSLVVMPISLLTNWTNEVKKFAPQLRSLIYSGDKRGSYKGQLNQFDVIFTTYSTLRNDLAVFEKLNLYYVILDESQAIKNPNSETFKSILSLKSKYRLVMTGTPIENSLTDLWAQFHFLNQGMLGSLSYFKKAFIQPIAQENDEVKNKLKKIISPLLLRREKETVVKDLPERSDFIFYSEMSVEQKEFYEEEKSKARNTILKFRQSNSIGENKIKILATLTKLRQIANHPMLVDENYAGYSGKFTDVLEQLNSLQEKGHKVLVFSQYVKYLELFQTYFDENEISYSTLFGSYSKEKRQKEIEQFQNGNSTKLFLISLKAGGVGLNLVEADYVFILDPWWNPQIEEQAIARAHRIGQTKKVFTYRFICNDTIEEKILKLQENKRQLATDILNDSSFFHLFEKEMDFLLE
jgi:SNF2 family DNA or RNA helicase